MKKKPWSFLKIITETRSMKISFAWFAKSGYRFPLFYCTSKLPISSAQEI